MSIGFLLERFEDAADREALIWRDTAVSYRWLLERIEHWRAETARSGVRSGSIIFLEADFSPNAVALFLALVQAGAVLVPFTSAAAPQRDEFLGIAQCEICCRLDENDRATFTPRPTAETPALYESLRARRHAGLVLFSSGSTGKSKASVHDLHPLLDKFRVRRNTLRAVSFLLLDHIGGVNTLLYTLSNAGCLVTLDDRAPDRVLAAIERHRVELLPTSPTFLNLVLVSEAYKRYDLSSLQLVTYGTEPMPEYTLRRFHELFPNVRLSQTYGLSEVGILRSRSKSSDSLWVKVGGEGYETRVVDGMLEIKAKSAMLGYLNAPSPFTEDGWFKTGDRVEVDGEYIRILCRDSEIINVGGQKVFPTEIENVIRELDNITDVTVTGEAHPITGNIVVAEVVLREEEDRKALTQRLKKHCRERLESYKIPVKIKIASRIRHSERFKKVR